MRKWKGFPGLPVVVLVLALSIKANSQSTPVNIKSAIQTALANNYSLKADSMRMIAAGYQVDIAKASLLPQISYSSKAEYNPAIPTQLLPGEVVGQPSKEYVAVQFGTRYTMGGGFEATQTLVRKDLKYQIYSAALGTGIAKTKYQMSREELIYQVSLTFYSLQTNAELIRTTAKDYQNMLDILKVAKAQYEHDLLRKIDYESLEINTANKQSSLNQLQTDYNDHLAYFNYLLGLHPATQTVIDDRLPQHLHYDDPGKSLSQRTDIRLYQQLIVQKETEIKGIKAERLPVINSYARFNYQSQFNKTSDFGNTDYWFKTATVGISTSIPIFDGRRRKNRIHVANTELQQLRFQNENQQQLAKTEQVRAWETFTNQNRQYQLTKNNLVLAEKVFESRKALYAEGVTTLIELLDAEKELSQSRSLHTQALIGVQTALVNIHKSNGTLLTDFIQSL
jgi:outer membrane protein